MSSSTHPHAQAMIALVGGLAQIAGHRANAEAGRDRLRYQHAIAELQASSLSEVLDAVITRRVAVVQDGFTQVLQHYADQAGHYMAQQERYAAAELDTSDPLRRIELRKRINDVDTELRQIQIDAKQLYARMTEVVMLIGGVSMRLDDKLAQRLMLAAPGL